MVNVFEDVVKAFAPTGEDGSVRDAMTRAFASLGLDVVHDGLGSTIAYCRANPSGQEAGKKTPVLMVSAPQDQRGFILVAPQNNSCYTIEFLEKVTPFDMHYQKALVKTRSGRLISGLLRLDLPKSKDELADKSKLRTLVFVPENPSHLSELEIGDLGTLDKTHFRTISAGDPADEGDLAGENIFEGAFLSTGILDYVLCRIAEILKDDVLDFDIAFTTIAHSTIGYRGSKTVTDVVKPTCAFALQAYDRSRLKVDSKSHAVYYSAFDRSMLPSRELMSLVESIPHCKAVVGVGSSDGSFIHKTQQGCPTVSMGVAVENHASAYERVRADEVERLAQSLVSVIRKLSAEDLERIAHKE